MTAHQVSETTVRAAREDEADTVARLIATAFLTIPPTEWLILDPRIRRRVFRPYLRIFVDHGLSCGTVDVAVDAQDAPVAATIWWSAPVPDIEDYEDRLAASVGKAYLSRFSVFDEGMHHMHPTEPHEYLGFAATWPSRQGEGHGGRLLGRRHAQLDAAGISAYLAAASEDARRLYLRHGYVDCGTPMQLPDGPPMWPMWRTPQAPRQAR